MKDLAHRLNHVHCLIQDIEMSGPSDTFNEAEYEYIYAALEDARELMNYLYPVGATRE